MSCPLLPCFQQQQQSGQCSGTMFFTPPKKKDKNSAQQFTRFVQHVFPRHKHHNRIGRGAHHDNNPALAGAETTGTPTWSCSLTGGCAPRKATPTTSKGQNWQRCSSLSSGIVPSTQHDKCSFGSITAVSHGELSPCRGPTQLHRSRPYRV